MQNTLKYSLGSTDIINVEPDFINGFLEGGRQIVNKNYSE
jgi:hypothetical protein